MIVRWSDRALVDLGRLRSFLGAVNPEAAIATLTAIAAATERLMAYPRLGERMEEYGDREVRRLIIGSYDLRYEVQDATISIVRVLHTRQRR